MKGYVVIKSFYHKRLHQKHEPVLEHEINPVYYDKLEAKGLIKWVERPEIIMPKKKKLKKKKSVRSSKRDFR